MLDKPAAIAEVCRTLSNQGVEAAADVLRSAYPFKPDPITKRRCGAVASTRVFVRDGFVDRYTGTHVVFPPVLRVLSVALPAEFPYHPHWKTDVTHPAYWDVGATIDHLVPVTRCGRDDESNWITASMASNSAKMNRSVEELGWMLHPPGDFQEWDGLIHWFLEYGATHPEILGITYVRQWHRAAKLAVDAA